MVVPFLGRRSPRLPRFDYGSAGVYFITVVAHQRRCLFAEVMSGQSVATDAGHMILSTWHSIPARHPGAALDDFVLMPNHVHGLLRLEGGSPRPRRLTVPAVVGAFKSLTTTRYIQGVSALGWPPFEQHLWQRSYYDRILRDEVEVKAVREYIATNPLRWTSDREFPIPRT